MLLGNWCAKCGRRTIFPAQGSGPLGVLGFAVVCLLEEKGSDA